MWFRNQIQFYAESTSVDLPFIYSVLVVGRVGIDVWSRVMGAHKLTK